MVTGIIAAGKSTVSQLPAERFSRTVHLRGDVFRRFVVTGRVDVSPQSEPEAERQLALRHSIAAQAANSYAAAGFTVIVQDLFVGATLQPFVAQLVERPVSLVMLSPDVAVVMQRESERVKVGYGDLWSVRDLDHMVRTKTPASGCGSTALSRRQTRPSTTSSRGCPRRGSTDVPSFARPTLPTPCRPPSVTTGRGCPLPGG